MPEYVKAFIHILCAINMPEPTIHYLTELFWNRKKGMDELVEYIEKHPDTTESDLLKESGRIFDGK